MKKFFSLVVLMCLLGVSLAWAATNRIKFATPSVMILHSNGYMEYEGQNVQFFFADGNQHNANIDDDFTWSATAYGDLAFDDNGTKNITIGKNQKKKGKYPVSFKGEGGAIVVKVVGGNTSLNNGQQFYGFYVITVPYEGNHIWNFEDFDHTGSITSDRGSVTPNQNAIWTDIWKSMSSQGNNHEIRVATPNESAQDGYSSIDGTNAYYIPETEGLLFYTNPQNFGFNGRDFNGSKKYVTWGGRNAHDDSGYNPTFKIPQVQGGKYIKVWWNGMDKGGLGANFKVENLLDLEGVEILNSFPITGVCWNTAGTIYYGGCVIFKVKGSPSERKDVVFKLTDTGWNDLYKIEVTDQYSTDMILLQQIGGNKEVKYNNDQGSFVVEESELNQGPHYYTETDKPYLSFCGANAYTRIERAKTCEFTVVQEPADGVVSYVQRQWNSSGANYYNLDITQIKGSGNIKVIQRVKYGNYVLDKNETWLAFGTYKQQSYPYTWDFTDYNVSQGNLYAWLSGSNTYGTQKYGHWKMGNSETYALETHEQVNGTILNGQTNQYEKVDKPLFAQGAQLTYWKQDNTIGTIKEAEGLRVKQAWGTKGELAVGEEFDGELSINGKCLKYTPAGEWSRLHITIPNVDAGMYVFIKADDGTEAENYANPSVKLGNSELTVDNSYNTKNKVRAYKVTTTGDVDITFAKAAQIKAIGVTNIFKSINALGYATESRDVDIDHIYEGEFTKNDVNAHCILTYNDEGFTYNYKGTPDVRKSQVMNVIPKNTGIVLYKEGHSGDAFNVPLFYPACNAKVKDAEQIALDNNWMAPNVESTLHSDEEEERNGETCTKFIMTRTYYTYNKPDGSSTGPQTTNVGAFYRLRIDKDASHTEAERTKNNTIGANKAYLLIPSTKLPTALWNGGNGQGVPQQAKGVIFIDLADVVGVFDGTTDINNIYVNDVEEIEQDVYYTLSGIRLERKPSAKGVYICNGKKVFVK